MEFDLQPRLDGELIALEPLRLEHFEPLCSVACDPKIWAKHPVPKRYEKEVFGDFFEEPLKPRGALEIRDAGTGAIIGSTRDASR